MENNNSKRNLQEEEVEIELPPGFRFHPTDEELITHYLSPKVIDSNFNALAIGEADLNKSEPWDLPGRAKMGEKEWYFFCVKDRKYPTGLRTNRATESGYWKATGKDKEINRGKRVVGMKKTLVFYKGRAPKGEKSNWVMHEYRLEGKFPLSSFDHRHLLLHLPKPTENEWVICRIFKKSTGEKRTHISELVIRPNTSSSPLPPLMDYSNSFYGSEARASHVTHPIEHNVEESKPQTTTTTNNMIYNFKTHNYYNHSPSSSSSHSSNPSRFLSQTPFHVFPNPKQPPVLSTNNQLHHSGKENPDSVWMQGNSIMRMLLEDKQRSNPKMEISQHMALGFNDQMVSSSHGIMTNSCCKEDEDFDLEPSISDGPIDLESLWNY